MIGMPNFVCFKESIKDAVIHQIRIKKNLKTCISVINIYYYCLEKCILKTQFSVLVLVPNSKIGNFA